MQAPYGVCSSLLCFIFLFWSSLMHSVINYQEPRNRIKLALLNTLVYGTSENSWWFTPLTGCSQPLHKRPVGEITYRKGGREGRNEITQIICYGRECISSSAIPMTKHESLKPEAELQLLSENNTVQINHWQNPDRCQGEWGAVRLDTRSGRSSHLRVLS